MIRGEDGQVVYKYTFWYVTVAVTLILALSIYFALTQPHRQIVVDCSEQLIVCEDIREDGDDEQVE